MRRCCGGADRGEAEEHVQQRKHARSHLTSATKRRLNLRRGRCDAEVRPSLLCRGGGASAAPTAPSVAARAAPEEARRSPRERAPM